MIRIHAFLPRLSSRIGILLLFFIAGCDADTSKNHLQSAVLLGITFAWMILSCACSGLLLVLVELGVLFRNFSRPSRRSIVSGYVFGVLQFAFGSLGILSVITFFFSPNNNGVSSLPTPTATIVMSILFGFILGGTLIGSSRLGEARLSPPQNP